MHVLVEENLQTSTCHLTTQISISLRSVQHNLRALIKKPYHIAVVQQFLPLDSGRDVTYRNWLKRFVWQNGMQAIDHYVNSNQIKFLLLFPE